MTPATIDTRAASELHFATPDSLLNGFFDSVCGRDEILYGVDHFVASANRFYLAEYPLRR